MKKLIEGLKTIVTIFALIIVGFINRAIFKDPDLCVPEKIKR